MAHKSILKEFFGLSSTTIGGKKFELGKVYSNPYANAFIQTENVDDDIDEYDVENVDDYEN